MSTERPGHGGPPSSGGIDSGAGAREFNVWIDAVVVELEVVDQEKSGGWEVVRRGRDRAITVIIAHSSLVDLTGDGSMPYSNYAKEFAKPSME